MEHEKHMTVKKEHVAIEDVTGRTFLSSTPSKGEEVIGRVGDRLFTWGWPIDDPDEDWSGIGYLGVKIDQDAFRLRRELIILDGFGEWLPEEGKDG